MRSALALAAAAALVAACGSFTGGPVVVSGTLVDQNGGPVGGATVVLNVIDDTADAQIGEAVPSAFEARVTSGADGRFEFRFQPTVELQRLAQKRGGYVSFSLMAWSDGPRPRWFWSFTREVKAGTWSDTTTPVRLLPVVPA